MTPNIIISELKAVRVIKSIRKKTSHMLFFTKVGNVLLWSSEILCYLAGISLLILSLKIFNNSMNTIMILLNETPGEMSSQLDELLDTVGFVKFIIAFFGVFMLVPAYLLRRLRHKNYQWKQVNEIAVNYLESENIA